VPPLRTKASAAAVLIAVYCAFIAAADEPSRARTPIVK
jgi:hypothetical protein